MNIKLEIAIQKLTLFLLKEWVQFYLVLIIGIVPFVGAFIAHDFIQETITRLIICLVCYILFYIFCVKELFKNNKSDREKTIKILKQLQEQQKK
jgi:uncharacterized membrane protein YfcA